MRLTGYMTKSRGSIVNCYDQAAAVQTLGTLLGIDIKYNYMDPFGYINKVNLVGVGECNNPFFNDPDITSDTNKIPLINPPSGNNSFIYPEISGFGNHAFTMYNGQVFDSCAGPVLGISVADYITNTIDKSTDDKEEVSGNAGDIVVQTFNNLQ